MNKLTLEENDIRGLNLDSKMLSDLEKKNFHRVLRALIQELRFDTFKRLLKTLISSLPDDELEDLLGLLMKKYDDDASLIELFLSLLIEAKSKEFVSKMLPSLIIHFSGISSRENKKKLIKLLISNGIDIGLFVLELVGFEEFASYVYIRENFPESINQEITNNNGDNIAALLKQRRDKSNQKPHGD